MTRKYLRGYVQRADGDESEEEGKPLRIIAATEGRKGDGLNLTMDTGDLGRYQANPVVGYGHNYWGRESLPIGRSAKTWVDGEKLMMDVAFDQDDDFARKVERKYRGGYLNAFSIGFDVWNIAEDGTPEGWELFEVSAVPLPMDPNAVVESGRDEQLALVRGLVGDRPDAETFAQAVMDHLAQLQEGPARAGKVLSKANKKIVKDAIAALSALLDAAGGKDDDEDDDGRRTGPDHARLLRLAGL